ncbi:MULTISPECIES: N-acetyltransferase [unclassified Bradyrhizobium]|uniref:N-acetyltransferase n=1 Tax=unclassified Bradyrhizobium TaxID=2631580 RepID=UPI002916441A|nr:MULTISPECIES: N-acetyltransferase [unclassified Bradyrhizobium]
MGEFRDNAAASRFELDVDGITAFVTYRKSPAAITLVHTEVPPELGGRGVGSKLGRATLDAVRVQGRKLSVECDFIRGLIRKTPEYKDLLAPEDAAPRTTAAYKASCFCGAAEVEAIGQPVFAGYCHCRDCQAWSAAPINAFSLWKSDDVRVVKGEAEIGTFNKTEHSYRKFCRRCGGHLMTEHPRMRLTDVYANLLQGFVHQPTLHVNYASKMISVKDGLPKFADLPADLGGSGETLPD